jgi:hypothetical protein
MRRPRGHVVGFAVIGAIALSGPPIGCGTTTQPTPSVRSAAAVEPAIPDPTSDAPVTAAAWIIPGTDARRGDMDLHVRARIAPGHYLHSTTAEAPFTPTSVELVPSDWITPAGGWELLTPPDAHGRLTDVVEFRHRVRLTEGVKPGRYEVDCTLKYQACTDELCWPPRVLELKAPLALKAAGP